MLFYPHRDITLTPTITQNDKSGADIEAVETAYHVDAFGDASASRALRVTREPGGNESTKWYTQYTGELILAAVFIVAIAIALSAVLVCHCIRKFRHNRSRLTD